MSAYSTLLKSVITRILFIKPGTAEYENRYKGLDWPGDGAETMIGVERLNNIEDLATRVLMDSIPGDFMECGVWKGGAAILMRAILKENRCRDRKVWVADSFEGLPKPNAEEFPTDAGDPHHTYTFLAVSQQEVQSHFERYGMFDQQVQFIKGFFKDSLPGPVQRLALLRVDADMYEGVTQALEAMYPLLSPGGYLIVDDYHNIANTHKAVDDFRARHGITAKMEIPIPGAQCTGKNEHRTN